MITDFPGFAQVRMGLTRWPDGGPGFEHGFAALVDF
jgi:hypothetical protein